MLVLMLEPAMKGSGQAPAPLSEAFERELDRLDGEAAPTSVAFFGDLELHLYPEDPPLRRIVAAFGDTTLDLRGLGESRGPVLVKLATILGDRRLIVPAGTRVVSRLKMLGGVIKRPRGVKGEVEGNREGLVIVLTGICILGDIVIAVDEL
ncbi:MAG: hypothetical protein Q8M76_10060 [Spirochaetaceae bacterium]|nr:hypothetical protein [Spirochaetaceae bacterium]